MTSVGMHEAKTRLSQLVQEVEAGGEVVITRHGRPVARLTRIEPRRRSDGFGSMRGKGTVEDLSWEAVLAGDAELLEMFGLAEPQTAEPRTE